MATLMRPHKLVLGVVIGTILFGGIITLSIVFINNNKVATNATSK
jgi:Flp pilus assembly protein protease CpaA